MKCLLADGEFGNTHTHTHKLTQTQTSTHIQAHIYTHARTRTHIHTDGVRGSDENARAHATKVKERAKEGWKREDGWGRGEGKRKQSKFAKQTRNLSYSLVSLTLS